MPWEIKENDEGQHCVYKIGEEEPLHCYDNQADAEAYGAALYANERSLLEFEFLAAAGIERSLMVDLINGLLKILPPQVEKKTFFIHRQQDEQYRWFAWPACTAFINRDQEIDSRALFDNFIQHIQEGADWPYLTFFHQEEKFKMGEGDFVARDGVAYLVSGLFDESRLAQEVVKSLLNEKERFWGTSIRYEPIGKPYYIKHRKKKIPVYYDGIHKEVSLLPEKAASSLFTAFPILKE